MRSLSTLFRLALDATLGPCGGGTISDVRLKTDVVFQETLPNGVKLYSFRYLGSNQTFVGAMAQDLLDDPRHKAAVRVEKHGYYTVDYSSLGLGHLVTRSMLMEGQKALERAA